MASSVVPARGMRDILPADKAKRDQILAIIRQTYHRNGFAEIETPAIEPLSRLLSNQGGDNEKMIFEILKRGLPADQPVIPAEATDLGLRYDLTVPLTRYYASHINELPRVFRALQTGPVWRAERPQKGRYRQFTQCDIDIIGDDSAIAEIDLLVSTLSAFEALGMAQDITLLINDRRLLVDLLTACGIAQEQQADALIVLDKIDKVGAQAVQQELTERELASADSAARLLHVIGELRDGPDPLAAGSIRVSDTETVDLRDLPQIVQSVKALVPWAKVRFDATLVRGMGYYTGPIFEITHAAVNFSVAGGGRYDRVVGKWLGRDVPACGFSIGFERIIDLVTLPAQAADRVALFYKASTDPIVLLQLRQTLQEDGAEVTLVIPPRRMGAAFFEGLSAEGFTHCLDATRPDITAADKREI